MQYESILDLEFSTLLRTSSESQTVVITSHNSQQMDNVCLLPNQ